jgi:protein O-GlcNAc transferase
MIPEKKIISFCLWGSDPKYIIGAIENAILASKIYPGWICRFYIGQSTLESASEFVARLEAFTNVEIVKMKEEGDWSGMLWRFFPISENDVDIMISRDTDSRLSFREKSAVDEWHEDNYRLGQETLFIRKDLADQWEDITLFLLEKK